ARERRCRRRIFSRNTCRIICAARGRHAFGSTLPKACGVSRPACFRVNRLKPWHPSKHSVQFDMPEITQYLEGQRERVNKALESALTRGGDVPDHLREAMHYGLLAPGKRLRPALVLMSAEAAGGDEATAMPAACAVEMIHAYSLVHDDLPSMDDDDLRRGLPTCHKKFGEATAILAGDALLTLAFQTLADGFPARTAAACCGELARASGAAGMVGGQALDLAWEQRKGAGMADLEQIHSRKTGALFGSSMRLGLISVQ